MKTLNKCKFWAFCCPSKKASLTASCFSLPIRLTFHTPSLKIVPNKAHPPTNPQDFALAFGNASSSSTLINALMRNCTSILCQVEMEIERCSNTELPSHDFYSRFLKCIVFFSCYYYLIALADVPTHLVPLSQVAARKWRTALGLDTQEMMGQIKGGLNVRRYR